MHQLLASCVRSWNWKISNHRILMPVNSWKHVLELSFQCEVVTAEATLWEAYTTWSPIASLKFKGFIAFKSNCCFKYIGCIQRHAGLNTHNSMDGSGSKSGIVPTSTIFSAHTIFGCSIADSRCHLWLCGEASVWLVWQKLRLHYSRWWYSGPFCWQTRVPGEGWTGWWGWWGQLKCCKVIFFLLFFRTMRV